MRTEITIDRTKFLVNGKPTYEGVSYKGKKIEGLLFNSRMVQAIFDDECPETAAHWKYPDTDRWDPERNTLEFCRALGEYRRHGLLAVTVGLQGGGPIYTNEIYNSYINSAYAPDGSFKEPYFRRLLKIIKAADDVGMVVIVNYFYCGQAHRIKEDKVIFDITERVTDWLLKTGYRNIIVDAVNESADFWHRLIMEPENVYKIIEVVKGVTLNNRRLYVSVSTAGGDTLPCGKWLETEDFSSPHGNGCTPEQLIKKLQKLKRNEEFKKRPRPIVINEDSVFIENLEAAISEYCSWGFYCQGYGCQYKDRMDWTKRPREKNYEELSGFQTPPVNWSINTEMKRRFFQRLKEITQGK